MRTTNTICDVCKATKASGDKHWANVCYHRYGRLDEFDLCEDCVHKHLRPLIEWATMRAVDEGPLPGTTTGLTVRTEKHPKGCTCERCMAELA